MSGSLESVRRNACVHRLDLGLYSNLKESLRMESEPMLTPREKSPVPEAESRIASESASHRTVSPKYYQLSYSGPYSNAKITYVLSECC